MMDELISRQAAIEAVGDVHPLDYNGQAILHRLKELPTIEPKKGKWIRKSEGMWTCSECKRDNAYAYVYENDFTNLTQQDFYCPNCGARMKRSEE